MITQPHTATKEEAVRIAQALLELMDHPKNWKIFTFKNEGWHSGIRHKKACVCVTPDVKTGRYRCFFDPECKYLGTTPAHLSDNKSYKDPNRAFRAQARLIRRHGEMLIAAASMVGC